MRRSIQSRLVDFVQTVTTDTKIDANTDLVTNNYLDSLLLMDLVIFIENETGVSLSGDEIAPRNFRTLGDLSRLVDRKNMDFFQERFAA